MRIEIDQSGKIEETARDTILALSNDKHFTIRLSAKDKKLIQSIFRLRNRHKIFVYLTFSALVFIILKKTKPKAKVIIDKEYPGKEKLIKDIISNFGNKSVFDFGLVGKSSKVHSLAYKTFKKRVKVDMTIKVEEILKLILPNKKDRESAY